MHAPADLMTAARAELARVPATLENLLAGLDAAAWRARPAPREWAPVEIVCHLRDEEVEDFGARPARDRRGRYDVRADRSRGLGGRARLSRRDGPATLAELGRRRAASVAWLAGVAPERLTRAVETPRAGRLSGLDLLAAWVAHDRLHLAQLSSTLARVWADRWAPLRAEYAGPIPYQRA
jgi:hypothetical protein